MSNQISEALEGHNCREENIKADGEDKFIDTGNSYVCGKCGEKILDYY
jgi:hypothetical protein